MSVHHFIFTSVLNRREIVFCCSGSTELQPRVKAPPTKTAIFKRLFFDLSVTLEEGNREEEDGPCLNRTSNDGSGPSLDHFVKKKSFPKISSIAVMDSIFAHKSTGSGEVTNRPATPEVG